MKNQYNISNLSIDIICAVIDNFLHIAKKRVAINLHKQHTEDERYKLMHTCEQQNLPFEYYDIVNPDTGEVLTFMLNGISNEVTLEIY